MKTTAGTTTTNCQAQTVDHSRCERAAARNVQGWHYCEQHAKRAERALARTAKAE